MTPPRLPVLLLVLAGCAATADEGAEKIGTRSQAIIDGQTSGADQDFVVEVALNYLGKIAPSCSGTMIAKNLVLTARHCVGNPNESAGTVVDYSPDNLFVFVGANATQRVLAKDHPDATGARIFTASTNKLFPDVALILLDTSLDVKIAPIRLEGGATKGEVLDVVGFGITTANKPPDVRMHRADVTVTAIGPGRTAFQPLETGEFAFGEAACSGDSGGPALSEDTNAVVGVASRVGNGQEPTSTDPSAFCVGTKAEDVYTSLAPVEDVITKAFDAAGAKPWLEGDDPPADPSAHGPSAARTPTANAGCAAAPAAPAGGAGAFATALAFAAALAVTRRGRRARAR